METFVCSITGTTPLLMHRFADAEAASARTRTVHLTEEDPRAVAEKAAYRSADGSLFLPGAAIARLLREAGSAHKQRGSRKSLKYVIPAAVLVLDDELVLCDEQGDPLRDFEVDSRPVVIPSTKGRVLRHRPRLNAWGLEFAVEIDEDMIDSKTVHMLITDGGKKIGLGDYRPERGGPFGRYQLVSWKQITQKTPAPLKRPQKIAA